MNRQAAQINQIARQEGWRIAAEAAASTAEDPVQQLEFITSEARADFQFLLPVNREAVVLDLDGGWGNQTVSFARTCKQVYRLDPAPWKMEFTRIRAAQEGLTNITCIQSHPAEIPLPMNSCHIALLTKTRMDETWKDQSSLEGAYYFQVLRAIWQRLVPGGCVFISVENRFSYQHLLGSRVPPSNLRFITLLPPSLARFYARQFRGVEYPDFTSTPQRIKTILNETGFTKLMVFFQVPVYPGFRFLADINSREATNFLISRLRVHSDFSWHSYVLSRIASAIGVLPYLAPGFCMLAYKESN